MINACPRSCFTRQLTATSLALTLLLLAPDCGGSSSGDIGDVLVGETDPVADVQTEAVAAEVRLGSAVGDRIDDLLLLSCDGTPHQLYEFFEPGGADGTSPGAEVLWLTLHAGWCTSCRAQHESLHAFHAAYAARGLRVVFVLGEGSVPGLGVETDYCEAFAAASDFDFPIFRDERFEATAAWNKGAWPVQLLIDPNGIIRAFQQGWDPSFHDTWFSERLDGLLP